MKLFTNENKLVFDVVISKLKSGNKFICLFQKHLWDISVRMVELELETM